MLLLAESHADNAYASPNSETTPFEVNSTKVKYQYEARLERVLGKYRPGQQDDRLRG